MKLMSMIMLREISKKIYADIPDGISASCHVPISKHYDFQTYGFRIEV